MLVYRIAKTRYIRDLSGSGSRTYGSRWSPPGISVIYASESRSLAALEFYVHTNPLFVPTDISIAEINIPDHIKIKALIISDLPSDWNEYPAPLVLQEFGLNWINSGESLALRVPSVQVRQEYNFLINPGHPDFASLQIMKVEEFFYDDRLLNR